MNEVIKSQNDVTVFSDGNVTISQRKLAKLLGVNENTLFTYIKRKHQNYNKSNGLDAEMVRFVSTHFAYKSRKTTKKAQELVDKFMEAGAKAFLYHEAGYEFKATRRDDIYEQLKEAQKKLAYCSIHADSLKATFELRENTKVNAIKESWVELGYLSKRTVMKQVTEYGITPEGSEHLYYNNKQIRIKPEAKYGLKLITHGFNIGRFGQSELFIA